METTRQLMSFEGLHSLGWRDAAEDVLAFGGRLDQSFAVEGIGLADAVVTNRLSVANLKHGVAWSRACDAESAGLLVGLSDAEISGSVRIEAMARRLAYLAGKDALEKVGDRYNRFAYQVNNSERLAGMDVTGRQAAMMGIDWYDITRIRIT